MSLEKALSDQADDVVDPRVQIELERLNSATDEINRLEVDLDEARNQFRQLLAESTIRINACSKKLGSCIEKARPYYDARLKAKEALQETQKAAVNFERANSAHAAAKEMVFLAEEGLKTEGRTFDHAWQEMLNHATMRVNESESERTRSEAEHKRTSQNYQRAEVRVQRLQKELKKAISKSRPYFELKISYTQLLEQQKVKVKNLEKQVSDVKLSYADTLKNLEHISDEIHKTRQKNKVPDDRSEFGAPISSATTPTPTSAASLASGGAKESMNFHGDPDAKSDATETGKIHEVYETPKLLTPLSEASTTKYASYTSGSSQPDTDMWSENSDGGGHAQGNAENGVDSSVPSPNSENDSSLTEPPDAESEDEFYKFPDRMNTIINRPTTDLAEIEKELRSRSNRVKTPNFFEGVGICSFPVETELNLNFNSKANGNSINNNDGDGGESTDNWTEIKLHSPEDEQFPKIKKGKAIKNELEEDYDIPYTPLSEMGDPEFGYASVQVRDGTATSTMTNSAETASTTPEVEKGTETEDARTKLNSTLNNWINKAGKKEQHQQQGGDDGDNTKSLKGTPKKMNIRRQSLDVLWNNATGEKVKEIFSQSILKLSIGSLSERRSSESKMSEENDTYQNEGDDAGSYESNLTSQFGLQFFTKKKTDDTAASNSAAEAGQKGGGSHSPQESLSNQIGGFITRKEKFFTKKVPSPLEKTLGYLNQDEDSNSDTESLASNDMLTDEQLASLVLDRDLTEIYQDIVS